MKPNLNLKIAIIGAGPSGLSAAEALSELGYKNVTLFEKRNRVGGQSSSMIYRKGDKEIIYEQGSLQPVGMSGKNFKKLLNRYDIHLGKDLDGKKKLAIKVYSFAERKFYVDFTKSIIGFPLTLKNIWLYVCDNWKVIKCLFRYRYLMKPGFSNLPPGDLEYLSFPYEQWIDNQNFNLITIPFKCLAGTALSPANHEKKKQIPLAFLIKLVLYFIKFPIRYVNGHVQLIQEGYQELWNRLAKNHNVHLNVDIKKITRENNQIQMQLKDEILTFDKLIIACPPDNIIKLMKPTKSEETIYSKIQYLSSWRAAFIGSHLPHDAVYIFSDANLNINNPNPLLFLIPDGQIDQDLWVYEIMLGESGQKISIENRLQSIKESLAEHFNGQVLEWLNVYYWSDYSPYLPNQDFKAGIYDQLESMQGSENTFYVGGVNNGMSHAAVIDYSYQLINRHFNI